MIPGEIIIKDENVRLNAAGRTVTVEVENIGDRPIQVGSHFHFFEVNKYLRFDRTMTYGYRLDIPSGTAVRFEPGQKKTLTLTSLGGNRRIYGLNRLTMGQANETEKGANLEALRKFTEGVE